MSVYIVIGYNSYTSEGHRDEEDILGVFHSIEKAEKYKESYLMDEDKDYDYAFVEKYIVQ